jgi:hypothetical protein
MFYCGCTCRRATYSLDLFLFADMEKVVFDCGSIVRVRAIVPCLVWIYFYLLIWRKECFIVKYSACTGHSAMYSLDLFVFADIEKRVFTVEV